MSDVSSSAVAVEQIDDQLAHLWMVRTFIKHSDEAQEDDDLKEVARELYDFILAVAPAKLAEDNDGFIKTAKKKFTKLRNAAELYDEIQADVSSHTNFEMANRSLKLVIARIGEILQGVAVS